MWAEISITYDKRICANGIDEVAEYSLKHAIVKDVLQIVPDIKRTLARLLKVTSKSEATKEVSQLYGFPRSTLLSFLKISLSAKRCKLCQVERDLSANIFFAEESTNLHS